LSDDTIEPFVVLTKVKFTIENDGSHTLSEEEKARITKLVDNELQQDNVVEEEDDEEDNDGEVMFRYKIYCCFGAYDKRPTIHNFLCY